MKRIILALFLLVAVASGVRAQTPPLYPANAKYLGFGGTGGGSANAQTVTYSPAITAYTVGQVVSWFPSNANTSAATLNVNGIAAKPIKKNAAAALVANDLITTAIAFAWYDGTNFELINPQTGNPASSVACSGLPALTGDTTTSAGSCGTTTAKINGTSFTGTNGDLVSFGASNTPADSGVVAANVTTQGAATSGEICTYTGSNRVCVPATALPNGVTATTQSANDNSTKVATDAYVDKVVTSATGTTVSVSGNSEIVVCTSTCTVTPIIPPALGVQLCVLNGDNVSTVITLAALGSSGRYENQARTAYGTATTGTLASGGAVKDQVCIFGLDSTHYLTVNATGTWTAN